MIFLFIEKQFNINFLNQISRCKRLFERWNEKKKKDQVFAFIFCPIVSLNGSNESIWYWRQSQYKAILTRVKILDDLCCLIFFTVWYTFTTPSVIIWSIKFDKAINTPVRPIPELISNKEYMKLVHFDLILQYFHQKC